MKKQLLLLASLLLLFVFSCKKDRLDLPDDGKTTDIALALKNLMTEEERNFFDKNYLIRVNPHVKETITTRDEPDDLTNAVFNYMLLKNGESQFVQEMVQKFGYPIWSESVIFPDINNPATKSLVTPFAKATSDHISGFLVAMPHGWNSSPIFALLMIDREVVAERVAQQWPDSMNLGFNVALHYDFDKELFATTDPDLENWIKNHTPDDGFDNGVVEERTSYTSLQACIPSIAFDDGAVDERDCIGYYVTINYFDCDDLFGLGSWMPSGNGSGSSGSSGGGGGGGGGGAAAPTDQQALDNYEYEKCQWYQSLEDGEVTQNQIPGGFNQQQADLCNALEQLQFLSIPHQAWLINNPETFGVVATWVLANLPIDSEEAQMLSTYLTLLSSGQTTLPFRDFRSLWVKVQQLQEELDLTQGEVNWLLQNQEFLEKIHAFWASANNAFPNEIEYYSEDLNTLIDLVFGGNPPNITLANEILNVVQELMADYPDIVPDLTELFCYSKVKISPPSNTRYDWNTTTEQKKIDMFMYAFRMSNNIPGTANSLKWTDFFSHYGAGCGSGCLLVGTAKLPNNQTIPVKLDVSTLYLETSRLPDVTGEVTIADGTWSQYGFYNYVNGQVGSIETVRLQAKQTSNISLFENMVFGW